MLAPVLQWVNKIYQNVDLNLDTTVSSRSSHSPQDVANLTGIKSVQSGTTSVVSDSSQNTENVSISSVNTSKSYVVIAAYGGGDSSAAMKMGGRLTSSTNLRLTAKSSGTGGSSNVFYEDVEWQVIEFE